MKAILILLVLLGFYSTTAAVENNSQILFDSKSLNETRKILVRLPIDYSENNDKSYPLLITLNDEDNFKWASSIVDVQAARFGIEDMIVVGLPHNGNYSKDNYPFKKKGNIEPNPQSEKYSNFIRKEIVPYVNKNYRTNGGKFIVGHSLSGLFVTNMFMQYPDEFSTFIVLSPSVHHAPQLSTLVKPFLINNKSLAGSIYISLGDMEHQQILQEYKVLKEVFENHAPQTLTWSVDYMENTDHLLAAYKGIYDSLTWVYRDWYLLDTEMQQSSLDDYIQHYDEFSKKLKYPIKPRERHLVSFSGFAKKKLNDHKAAVEALKTAIHYYPNSQNPKDKLKEIDK